MKVVALCGEKQFYDWRSSSVADDLPDIVEIIRTQFWLGCQPILHRVFAKDLVSAPHTRAM